MATDCSPLVTPSPSPIQTYLDYMMRWAFIQYPSHPTLSIIFDTFTEVRELSAQLEIINDVIAKGEPLRLNRAYQVSDGPAIPADGFVEISIAELQREVGYRESAIIQHAHLLIQALSSHLDGQDVPNPEVERLNALLEKSNRQFNDLL